MTVQAHLAVERVLEFPDGTDPAIIQQTVKRVIGQQLPTPPHTPTPAPIKGSIFPFNRDFQGNVNFDPSAGILGAVTNALQLGPDVASGQARPSDLFNPNVPPNREMNRQAMGATALTTPISTATRAGEAVMGGFTKNVTRELPKTPTTQALKEAGAAGFEKVRGMNVDFSAAAIKSLSHDIQQDMVTHGGLVPPLAPKTSAILGMLQTPPEGAVVSFDGMVAARKALQNIAGDFNNQQDALAAKIAVKRIDQFLSAPDEASVVAGPAAAAGQTFAEANANYAAAKRAEKIAQTERRADLRSSGANSGLNYGNTLRQRLTDLILKPKETRGFTDAETAQIEQIIRGSFGANSARRIGNMLGGGGGLGQTLISAGGAAAGSMMGGAEGAAVGATALPVIGAIARHGYNKLVENQLDKAAEIVRQRSPLYQQLLKLAPDVPKDPVAQKTFLRLLLPLLEGQQNVPQGN